VILALTLELHIIMRYTLEYIRYVSKTSGPRNNLNMVAKGGQFRFLETKCM